MSITIPFDGTPAPAQAEYGIIPEHTRLHVNITPTRKDGTTIEVRPYANSGANAHIQALNPRFVVAAGQEYAGRNLFERIPLARKWASGSAVSQFFGFFGALGFDLDNPQGLQFDDRALLGKQLEVVVGDEKDQNGVDQNRIKFFNPAKPGGGTPYQQSAPAAAPAPVASFGQQPQQWAPPQQAAVGAPQPVAENPLVSPAPAQQTAPQFGAQGQPDWMAHPDPAASLQSAATAVQTGF